MGVITLDPDILRSLLAAEGHIGERAMAIAEDLPRVLGVISREDAARIATEIPATTAHLILLRMLQWAWNDLQSGRIDAVRVDFEDAVGNACSPVECLLSAREAA